MTATVIKMSIQRMVCIACGAEANASCNCGVAYQPKSIRAAEAIEANPEKSDRAIAAEIGVHKNTVNRARNELAHEGQLEDGPRIGLDGLTRKLPVKKTKPTPELQQQVQKFNREILDFIGPFNSALTAWIETNPELTGQMKSVLTEALQLCADRCQKLTQALDGR